MNVPFVDLVAQHNQLKKEINESIFDVVNSASFVLGPQVKQFEKSFAQFLKTSYSVGLASATDALYLAFRTLGIREGDEVIIPANTFVATAIGILECGAKPVLVDMDPDTYLIDTCAIETAITSHTKAICPVHLYGRACDMDAIINIANKHSLSVVEDVAQAPGASWSNKRAGTFGDFGCFSFYPSKNLGAYGDAGAMSMNSEAMHNKIASLRNFGSERKYHYPEIGINSRMDSIHAAVLNVKLRYLDNWNKKRWDIAKKYCELLAPLAANNLVKLPHLATPIEHVFHLFVIEVYNRDAVKEKMALNGISCGVHYPVPFYLESGYRDLGYSEGTFPNNENACKNILSLPIFPELSDDQIEYVATNLSKCINDNRPL
jgi:dTDP-4-amino-4,6-dideoxygalactose transaminase|tara:strand:+ start:301 stop:1428 length:1128 start_codon:yes stop_codon:yes gene_type:complete